MMTKKKKMMFAASGASFVLTLGVAFGAPAAQAHNASSIDDLVPAFSQPQTEADRVPETVDLKSLGVTDIETVRAVGSEGPASYWVARSGSEDVCLIVSIEGGNEVSASSCGPVTAFATSGMGLIAGSNPESIETIAEGYLLPADVQIPGDVPAEARSANSEPSGANLLTVAPGQEIDSFETTRSNGSAFTFNPLEGR